MRSRILASRLRESVLVTTKTGDTFSGVLYSHDTKALVLKQVQAVGAGDNQTNVPLDGELILLLPDVAWIQRP